MKVAVVGSRELIVPDLGLYLPKDTTEIIPGGAWGIQTCAKKYAQANRLKLTEFPTEYEKYGQGAPFERNHNIIVYADVVVAFWDGTSLGTGYVIDQCIRQNKALTVYVKDNGRGFVLALKS